MKKNIKIVSQIILGLFFFYNILGFVVIPMVMAWAIKDQGTKLLKHPVSVKAVSFNPLTLTLDIQGLSIGDQNNHELVGFKHLGVDISFLKLFKKKYVVESFVLNGFNANITLSSGGKINLLDLIPVADKPAPVANKEVAPPTTPDKPAVNQPLPEVVVDKFNINDASVQFTDQSISPTFKTSVHGVHIGILGLTTKPDCQLQVTVKAQIDGKGQVSNESILKPFSQPLSVETTLTLNDYALNVLSPYVGKYTGHALDDGKFDIKMDYRIENNQLKASHHLLIQHFTFGQKVESKDALPLPFGLAIALLEDPSGKIKIDLPVTGDLKDPKFEYFHLIGQVVRNFFIKIVTKPFSLLASLVSGSDSGTDELGYIMFKPGQATIDDQAQQKLTTLIKGLKERPKLQLIINGAYDPDLDWKAIKTQIFSKEYSALREDSTRKEAWVYQTLYQRRFGIRALWTLTKRFKGKSGSYDEQAMNVEIKRQLIEDAPADKVALDALGQLRAKNVYDMFVAKGMDEKHVTLGVPKAVQASMGNIALEFALVVFGEK